MSQRGCTPLDTPVCPVRHDRRRTDTDKQFVEPKKQETNMGYISIQINKAKGSADTGASDHIERKTMPKNADPTRTHLNRELVEFPDGVADRTEAISHRIHTAGIRRKITPDQVRAIRIVLSGSHEDMVRVQDEGRLGEWCDDNLQWLHRTFGKENTVSAVLHMDEHTPHIHATVVPIVTGELEANVQQLQTERQQAKQELDEVKKEIKSEKLEAAKTEAKAALVAKVGSLLGSGRLKELEADNRTLQGEVAARDESIELLQQQMERQQEEHSRQLMELQSKHRREMADKETAHQKEVSFLKSIIQKAKKWFPLFQELVYMEEFCLKVGFNERQTATLISGKPLFYEGELYSEEHRRKFMTESAGFQVVKDPADKSKLALAINGQVIGEWFKEQFDRLFSSIRKTVISPRSRKSLRQ